MIYTGHSGTNADMIADAAKLYIADGARVADVTFGKGAFWRKADLSRFTLIPSDLRRVGKGVLLIDFRSLPYRNGSIDTIILDPPYIHNPGRHITNGRYGHTATTRGLYNADIIQLYREGMVEGRRVLRSDGGQLWVKCKDEVEAGVQRWSHIMLYYEAIKLGFYARDLFVIIPDSRTSSKRWERQLHARKNHSFLWVFERPDESYRRLLERNPPSRKKRDDVFRKERNYTLERTP